MEQKHIKHALRAFAMEHGFLAINKQLIQTLGLKTAVYVSNLIDKYLYFMENNKLQKDGSFYLTHDQQKDQTGLSMRDIILQKRRLKEQGILTTSMEGVPAKEFYKLDFEKFFEWIDISRPPKSDGSRPPKSDGSLYNKENKSKENKYNKTVRANESEKKSDDTSQIKPYLPSAQKLGNIIRTKKNVKHTPAQIKGWAKEIKSLVEKQGVSMDRVDAALDWYEDNIGRDYVPVVESGSSLRQKWIRLEDAMERSSKSYNRPAIGKKKYPDETDW